MWQWLCQPSSKNEGITGFLTCWFAIEHIEHVWDMASRQLVHHSPPANQPLFDILWTRIQTSWNEIRLGTYPGPLWFHATTLRGFTPYWNLTVSDHVEVQYSFVILFIYAYRHVHLWYKFHLSHMYPSFLMLHFPQAVEYVYEYNYIYGVYL